MTKGVVRSAILVIGIPLSACVTARMHTKAELNGVEQSCGLAVGELIQDESEKRLLILFRVGATAEERSCV